MTVAARNLFHEGGISTEDLIKEPRDQRGLVHAFLGHNKTSALFVYDRCGWLVDELPTMFPATDAELNHWRVIRNAYHKSCGCKPAPTSQIPPQVDDNN